MGSKATGSISQRKQRGNPSISAWADRLVIDRTGLMSKFDWDLQWTMEPLTQMRRVRQDYRCSPPCESSLVYDWNHSVAWPTYS
jgi:hypothetical protein